jgi:recombination protein RecT
MFELVNGFRKEIYWSKTKMEEHAKKYSLGYRSDVQKGTSYTFWSKDFDAMASKTLIRQLISKWGVMSIDLQRAYESDMGVLNESGGVRYVDNQADDPLELAKEEIAENANKETLMVDIETGEVEV